MTDRLPKHALDRLLDAGRELLHEETQQPRHIGRFQILREIGRGGMGVVHEAWDPQLGRRVAVKALGAIAGLNSQARDRFAREARAAARLSHPNIAAVYDATSEWIAMELIEGSTVGDLGKTDMREAARLIRDAARAAHEAHEHGLVHRDIKPSNLMVAQGLPGEPTRLVVMDFGLARDLSLEDGVSQADQLVGTPAWMAPEQARGESIGPAADVYSLGACLYYLLCGQPPFDDKDVYRLLGKVANEAPPSLRNLDARIDPDLAVITAYAMRMEPERRYADAAALADDLDRFLRSLPVSARPSSLGYRLGKALARGRRGLLIAAVAAIGVGMLLVPALMLSINQRRVAEDALELAQQIAAVTVEADAALRAGQREKRHRRLTEGLALCDRFLEETQVAKVHLFRARLFRALYQYDRAEAALTEALRLNPHLEHAILERGVAKAEEWAERKHEHGDGDPAPELRRRALADLESVDLQGMKLVTEKDRLYARALSAWLNDDDGAAIDLLKEVIELDSIHYHAYRTLSWIYGNLGDSTRSSNLMIRAVDVLSGLAPAYESRRTTTRSSLESVVIEGIRGLIADFRAAPDSDPDEARMLAYRAQQRLRQAGRLLAAGERDNARELIATAELDFDAAVTLGGERAPVLATRALCASLRAELLLAGGHGEESRAARDRALNDFQRAAQLDSADVRLLANRGFFRLRDALGTRSRDIAAFARIDLTTASSALPSWHAGRELIDQGLAELEALFEEDSEESSQ